MPKVTLCPAPILGDHDGSEKTLPLAAQLHDWTMFVLDDTTDGEAEDDPPLVNVTLYW